MIVLNLWSSPSSGKSTAAAGLFYIMKGGFNVEMAREYAKELIWEKKFEMFDRQDLVKEKNKKKRVKIYKNEVDYVISDFPLFH